MKTKLSLILISTILLTGCSVGNADSLTLPSKDWPEVNFEDLTYCAKADWEVSTYDQDPKSMSYDAYYKDSDYPDYRLSITKFNDSSITAEDQAQAVEEPDANMESLGQINTSVEKTKFNIPGLREVKGHSFETVTNYNQKAVTTSEEWGIRIKENKTNNRIGFFDYNGSTYSYKLIIYDNEKQAIEDFKIFVKSLKINGDETQAA